ncbi:MAG: glycosyltransferase family 4 protein [Chloroflexi bacterium]|nr:glycosyltransferase family 4 protein [Chloroflexota bacterium]MCI0580099.1 glycosyltransferase family 4 protein [Chloroflexota bacterium]MCI0649325.1 glycosyltransferase family 4 protein [Chloroflexota bacterium]MCI0725942.1 glycosyltransferase family 4 protein [Chloroflexota bacterium]
MRTHHLVRYLAQANEVWFAFRGNGQRPGILPTQRMVSNVANRYAQLFHPRFFWQLWRLACREQVDLIVVSHLWGAVHGLLLKLLTRKPLVLDHHNVEYLRFRRMGSPFWPLVALLELITCYVSDQLICVSPVDKAILTSRLRVPPGKLRVVPNGADVARLAGQSVEVRQVKESLGLQESDAMILFFGSLSHLPNAQATDVILEEIVPRLESMTTGWKVVIVGVGQEKYLAQRRRPLPANVLFAGFVDEVAPLIKSADVVIVPLTAGSGTRFKIIEAVACGRRVVSTTVGAEGLDRRVFGEALVVADEWDAFARLVIESLARSRDVDPGPEFAVTYDWQRIFSNLCLDKI